MNIAHYCKQVLAITLKFFKNLMLIIADIECIIFLWHHCLKFLEIDIFYLRPLNFENL